jgi:oligopeptide/dipeptide ABC transporter ATP-binding protein
MATLEVQGLTVEYHRHRHPTLRAVVEVDLEVDAGEVVGLVGESGCGKSTLARGVIGLLPRAAGTITLDGAPVDVLGRRARPLEQRRFQMVFQDPYSSLNPRRRVGSQIADGLRGQDRGDVAARVRQLLEQVGMPATAAGRYPHEFSGGQRQRIAIARALAPDPRVIIADEAVSALDASTQAQVANLLVRLTRELGMGLLFISHDLGIVRHISDRVAVMYLGRVVEQAPTPQLWATPRHPYTQALIRAIPRHDGSGLLPEALAGEVPDPADPPSGCRFHPRCPSCFARCPVEEPTLMTVGGGQAAACWLVDEHETVGVTP